MPRRKQPILIAASDVRRARQIAKTACFAWNEVTYVYKREQLHGIRNGILLLDGTGDYSLWNDMDPYAKELERMESVGFFTTVIIPI